MPLGPHPSACILSENEIIACVEEERFLRTKNVYDVFPSHSVRYCLNITGIRPEQLSMISIGWDANRYPKDIDSFYRQFYKRYFTSGVRSSQKLLFEFEKYRPEKILNQIETHFRDLGYMGLIPEVRFYSHHDCQANAAYHCYSYDQAAVIVIDGAAETSTLSAYLVKNSQFEKLLQYHIPHSLGWFYRVFARYCGFVQQTGDVHLMNLSGWGKHDNILSAFMDAAVYIRNYQLHVAKRYAFSHQNEMDWNTLSGIFSVLGDPRMPHQPFRQHHFDIAFAAQRKIESICFEIYELLKTKIENLPLLFAGALSENTLLMAKIAEKHRSPVSVQPGADSAGGALGAAICAMKDLNSKTQLRYSLADLGFGPGFCNEDIELVLKKYKLRYNYITDAPACAARDLANGLLIAWFQGRMEMGSKALGNRSIFANPSIPGVKERINEDIKHRQPWQPFSASVTHEYAKNVFGIEKVSPYMGFSFPVSPKLKDLFPSIVHHDHTIRMQTVDEKNNPLLYQLIQEFEKISGVGSLLNTSFNLQGEPIVCNPEDAVSCFFRTGVDKLYIGNFVLQK